MAGTPAHHDGDLAAGRGIGADHTAVHRLDEIRVRGHEARKTVSREVQRLANKVRHCLSCLMSQRLCFMVALVVEGR